MSIYERINQIIQKEGYVPYDFELEERNQNDNEIRFAPGALEGILGHHSSGKGEDVGKLAAFFKTHLQEESSQIVKEYEKDFGEFKMATCRNELLKEILDHRDEYDANRLVNLAIYMMVQGEKVETVKTGLVLMALFNMSEEEQVKHVLITLGCCEEFTDYMLSNILSWSEEEQNKVYFELAKKLTGWGKITVVEQLQADTEEIREWILCEGCRNDIMYSYLGLECARKCDYLNRLRAGKLNEKELQGATDIMDGLLDEGPCQGISILEDAEETIYWYLRQYENREIDVECYSQFLIIKKYLETENEEAQKDDNSYKWEQKALQTLNKILSATDVKMMVFEGLEENTYNAISIAKELEINIGPKLLALMQNDFKKYYMHGFYFFTKEQYIEEYVALAEKNLDYEKLPTGMGKILALGKQEYWSVDMIVQYLDKYPGWGKELVRVSLKSPITRWRNMAAKTLEGWKLQTNQSLYEFDAELYQNVRLVAEEECDEDLQKRWIDLLENK
ncbi:MAG: hypothetical protein II992_01915 [Lachnospiraceae bacterium]|nr:hypothetical protein [Lachnospiraceae bacterium]